MNVCRWGALAHSFVTAQSPRRPASGSGRIVRAAAAVVLGALAACGEGSGPVPIASYDRTRHDFGVATQQADLVTEFLLTNRGGAPLRVTGVHGNCGCLVGTAKATTIAPGASTNVVVTFRTHAMAGPQTKWVRVTTDDPAHPHVPLEVSVDISAGVLIEPANFYFPLSLVGSSPSPSVVLTWKEGVGTPFQVTRIEGIDVDAEFETKPYEAPPFRGWEIALRFRKPPGIGTVSGHAKIHTDAPDRPSIDVLVGGAISGRVWLTQREASVGAVAKGKGAVVHVLVRGFDSTVDLGDVTATAERGHVTAKAVRAPEAKGAWNVEIRLPDDAPVGTVDDRIRVTTEVRGEETHWISVGGLVLQKAP